MKFLVPLTWCLHGDIVVTADTKADALKQVLELPRLITKDQESEMVIEVKKIRRLQ